MSRAGGLVAAVLVLLLSACTTGDRDDGPAQASQRTTDAVAELEREWQVTSYATIPQSWNEHYWLSDWTYHGFDGAGMHSISTGLKMFDAQTGKRVPLDLGGHACGVPTLRPGDTRAVITVSADPPRTYYSKSEHFSGSSTPARECDGLAVYDMTTGRKAWEWPVGSKGSFRYRGSDHGAVMVTRPDGTAGCFDLEDGKRLSVLHHRKCVIGDEHVPPLLDEHGARLRKLANQEDIARIDGVLLIRGRLPAGPVLVRAHDLETGLTLWADEVDPDPNVQPPWDRTETYAASTDSLLRVRYEFETDPEDAERHLPTYAFISRVDPRTGEELEQVGTVEQGLFLAQVGDVAVMGVDQELGMDAHLAGFRIPPAAG